MPRAEFWDIYFARLRQQLTDQDISALLDGSAEREARSFKRLAALVPRLAGNPYGWPAKRIGTPDGDILNDVVVVDSEPWRAFVLLGAVAGRPTLTAFAVRAEGKTQDQQLVEIANRLQTAGMRR